MSSSHEQTNETGSEIDEFIDGGEYVASDDEDEVDNLSPVADAKSQFTRISSKQSRQKQGSQQRKRCEQALTRMMIRSGVYTAAVFVNEAKNTYYFSTAGGGNYFKHVQLVLALEREKLRAKDKKRTTVSVELEDVLKSFRGDKEKKGERYMVKVSQCFEELGIDEELLTNVHKKYEDSLVDKPQFDVASALKTVIEGALNNILEKGFPDGNEDARMYYDDDDSNNEDL